MTRPQIETIPILPLGMLNSFLIIHGEDAILVDTGLPGSEAKIFKRLKKLGLSWLNVKLIVLTHAHIDHAGSAIGIKALTAAPICAHALEVPYCSGQPPRLAATGPFGRAFQKTGAIERPFSYFKPDEIMTAGEMGLEDRGFPLKIIHTPGHTPGSVSVLLEDGRVIAGDLAASGVLLGGILMRSKPKRPPFEEDQLAVAASLEHLLQRGCKTFYLGHGGPLSADRIKEHVSALRRVQV
ncbi:MBL fold metallo-hydrolase [Sulfitobacter sp. G21635-S1]|uniref:MBL fold metallo-hydrolase n=1 Tax=Sulfitobacter sp. G21635-S1 TaxID=3014043 RepID=UPI0022AF4097|nr:MBL fold metallo-hydrolase [Sulfitobacter sp. G21635-S1]MCZ4255111.1 MBL fold metallo-hydrolase [Sulfitobacter sp. G21635-S1]